MSIDHFNIVEHVIPACHIREYPGSTVNQEDVLQLHVKQYTPKVQAEPVSADAITIIATHGVALPKELYEPLWDEMLKQSRQRGVDIRSIWIADFASMGMSGVLNEDKLSTDCSWMDHARDLLLLINHFRDLMHRPLIGIGHSFGGTIITNLAYLHPRLFTTVLLLDPVIQLNPPTLGFNNDPPGAANFTLWRKDVWPTRDAAVRAHGRLLQGWDTRCVDRWIQYGFRSLPTLLYPCLPTTTADSTANSYTNPANTPVTLTTTKYQDLVGQVRENFSSRSSDGRIVISRATHADMDPLAAFIPLYRPEPRSTFFRLSSLRPPCLWVLGGATYLNLDEIREGIKACGQGIGGSGNGCVKEVTLPGLGHLFPFQAVSLTAETCATWLASRMEEYRLVERDWEKKQQAKSKEDHLTVSKEWYAVLKSPVSKKSKL